jgi:hypothetical protein
MKFTRTKTEDGRIKFKVGSKSSPHYKMLQYIYKSDKDKPLFIDEDNLSKVTLKRAGADTSPIWEKEVFMPWYEHMSWDERAIYQGLIYRGGRVLYNPNHRYNHFNVIWAYMKRHEQNKVLFIVAEHMNEHAQRIHEHRPSDITVHFSEYGSTKFKDIDFDLIVILDAEKCITPGNHPRNIIMLAQSSYDDLLLVYTKEEDTIQDVFGNCFTLIPDLEAKYWNTVAIREKDNTKKRDDANLKLFIRLQSVIVGFKTKTKE